ncbi:MAG: methyl-accepting chemotaxis protein [Halanaerobium sp.]
MFKVFRDLNLGVKIGGGFAILLIIAAFMAIIGYNGLNNVSNDVQITNDAAGFAKSGLEIRKIEKEFILREEEQYIEDINSKIDNMIAESEDTKALMTEQVNKDRINQMQLLANEYRDLVNKYSDLLFQQNELRTDFINAERQFKLQVSSIKEVQMGEFESLLNRYNSSGGSGVSIEELNAKINIVLFSQRLLENIDNIGLQERNYIINLANAEKKNQYADSTLQAFETAKKTAAELRDSFSAEPNIKSVENIIAELENSEQIFEEIHSVELEKDENATLMENKAGEFIAQADRMQALQLEKMESVQMAAVRELIIALIIAVGIGAVIAFFITKSISKPINLGVEFAEEIASGNLAAEKIDIDSDDEIGILARALNTMQNQLRGVIKNVSDIANNLAASSEELSASGEEVAAAAQQVGQSIQQVASGAEEQSAQVEETNSRMNELIGQINDVSYMSDEMEDQADNVMNNIKEGNTLVNNSVGQIEAVKNNSNEVSSRINKLGNLSNKIGEIVQLINNIAAQTNLLALNAAIEAARAGEAGRGFSVVADEIRQLAEESENATNQISSLVKEIQNGVGNAVEKMDETEAVVDQSVDAIKSTGSSFEKINKATTNLIELIGNIGLKAKNVGLNGKEVESIVQEIASVSEEAASNSEEVAAASEEQSSSTQEIVNASEELANIANELTNAVNKFKL